MISLKAKGFSELESTLRRLPVRLARRSLSSAVGAAATVVAAEARRRAPVDTGRLRSNIYRFKLRGRQTDHSVAYGVSVRTKGKSGTAKNAFYWRFVEFGTRFVRARPFLRPGFEASKGRAVAKMREQLAKRLVADVRALSRRG
jgi:HK97 gp10 family phage protein